MSLLQMVKETIIGSEVEKAQKELELAEIRAMKKQMDVARMHFAEAERLADPDEDDWDVIASRDGSGETRLDFTPRELKEIRNKCRKLVRDKPTARNIVRLFQKYVIGKNGMKLVVEGTEDEELTEHIQDVHNKWATRQNLRDRQLECVRRGIEDGEIPIRMFPNDNDFHLRFMDPNRFMDTDGNWPYGVEHEEDDVENIRFYHYLYPGKTESERIPAGDIEFLKLNSYINSPRGLPLMYTLHEDVNRHDTWIRYRMALNKARSAVVFVRKYKGSSPSQIRQHKKETRDDTRTTSSGKTIDVQKLRPGTKIDLPEAVDYEFKAPNINASDVAEDGRSVLLQIARGASVAEYMATGDASNSNLASTMVAEAPSVKEFQMEQGTYGSFFSNIAEKWKKWAMKNGELDLRAKDVTLSYTGPKCTVRDELEQAKAHEIEYKNGVVSLRSWREDVGYDHQEEAKRIRSEAVDDLYEKPGDGNNTFDTKSSTESGGEEDEMSEEDINL